MKMTNTSKESSNDAIFPAETILLLWHALNLSSLYGIRHYSLKLAPERNKGAIFFLFPYKKKCQEEKIQKRIDYNFREQQISASGFMDFLK